MFLCSALTAGFKPKTVFMEGKWKEKQKKLKEEGQGGKVKTVQRSLN